MSILSLPTELLELIFSFCPNATLVKLAQTSKDLNTMALQSFFRRSDDFLEHITNGLLHSWSTPRETSDAVRVAFFLKNLSTVTWSFNPGWECTICSPNALGLCPGCRGDPGLRMGPLKRTFDEIANLRAIFSRLPSARSVKFDFHNVQQYPTSGGWVGIRRHTVSRDLWRTALVGLLDEALENGCRTLEVENGDGMERMYTLWSGLWTTPYTPPNGKSFMLSTLKVHSDMLLQPPFVDWTTSLLTSSACAATLTNLSIQTLKINLPPLLLGLLNLPNLTELEIKSRARQLPLDRASNGIARFGDIASLLGRHSRQLKKVHLYGVGLPGLRVDDTTVLFDSNRDILPNLESFIAHPSIVMWLLNLPISCPKSIWRTNTSLENLQLIGISSEYNELHSPFVYVQFDMALSVVVGFCGWRNGENRTSLRRGNGKLSWRLKGRLQEKPLEVMLRFVSENDVHAWFASHLVSLPANEQPGASILTQLTHISTLTISSAYSTQFSDEAIEMLPDWLALISNSGASSISSPSERRAAGARLQRVTFIDHPSSGFFGASDYDQDQFVKEVAEKCVGLKWLQMDWNANKAIDLDAVRAIEGAIV
ncbi:hypothetical protein GALMADRAFT_246035 [Galerina marginata CBS 339.88]|uniref:F-box domain-containing protein n=1 Tax=Galerina marginata (strain CBS 339.88) TaxID=685588 RepID=A0A067T163_GALM3|nr:hypothetical protein GALMADRAFT_246035 [Galerina marginata CBS 339.88]